ncbi:MAG: histidinol-phosphate transaminase [Thermodesulfobacteriota bacterium]
MKLQPPEYVLAVKPYAPGKPIEELEREYGLTGSIKLASNENPLGPSPLALEAISQALSRLHRYPDGSGYYLVRKLSEKFGVRPENIILGSGSDDIIGMLTRALLYPGDEVIMSRPSFSMYEIMTRVSNARPVFVPLRSLAVDLDDIAGAVTSKTRMIFLTNPHNPAGTIFPADRFGDFLKNIPETVTVVLDEAYVEFARDPACADSLDFLDDGRPLAALRTFSKIYGLAGLRVGYGFMPPEMVSLLNRVRQPFNVGSLAQVAAVAALDDDAFLQKTRQVVHDGLDFLFRELKRMGVTCFPTQSNFFLLDVERNADEVFTALLREGVIVRSMTSYGYPTYLRVNAGLPEENVRFIEALEKVLS